MSRKYAATILAACLAGLVLALMTSIVLRREGNLAWDDADYLRRGLRIANRAADSSVPPVHAMADILRERPKPPLLVSWIAASTTIVGRTSIPRLLIAGSVGPFALLLLGVALVSRRHFGPSAAVTALLATVASPLVLSLGAKVMVETYLALTILSTLHFAALALERPSFWRSFALGISIGLAMLTKLTVALLLPGPALVFGLMFLRKYGRGRDLERMLGASLVGMLLVAAPWYIENGRVAVEFARFSSRYNIEAEGRTDRVDSLSRVVAIGSQVMGWPNLAVLGLSMFGLILPRRTSMREEIHAQSTENPFSRLATTGLVTGAIGLLIPAYFDPRFLSPIWPSFAVVLGGRVMQRGSLATKILAISLLLSGSAWSFSGLNHEPATRTYWAARTLIDELVARHGVRTIGNVGDTGDWNVCKTGMLNETRPHAEKCFVLQDLSRLSNERILDRLAKLDAVVVLQDSEALSEIGKIAPGLNRARQTMDSTIEKSGRFRRLESLSTSSLPALNVYVRK